MVPALQDSLRLVRETGAIICPNLLNRMQNDEGWLTHLSAGVGSQSEIPSANHLHHKGKSEGCNTLAYILLIGIWRKDIVKKIKEILFSEKGMKIVNTLFLLSLIFYRSGLLFIAYIAWIAYLAFCIKHTDSKGSKIVYSTFIGVAVIMICLNLYFLLRE